MHQDLGPPPSRQLTLVCDSPVSFDSFVRILVPVDAAEGPAEADDDQQQRQHTRALLTCEVLNNLDAMTVGFAAFPCSHTHVQVVSHKVLVCSGMTS
jgi:hypothetical protein